MPGRLLLSLFLLVAIGCSKPRFAYEVDAGFGTGSYRTVAPDPRRDRIVIREGMRPLNPDLHLQATLAELTARNYQPAPATEADLWVTVYVLIGAGPEGGSARPSHREGSGEGHRGGGRGSVSGGAPGKEGERGGRGNITVIVQLAERKSGRPVWQGEAAFDHMEKGADGAPMSIEGAVHRLLLPLASRR